MTEIIVKTQAELDAALARDDIDCDTHEIIIDSPAGVWITIGDDHGQDVRASDSATVRAWGSATVEAYDSATVEASGSATVRASGSATVEASGSATVRASGSATVEASGSATVRASGSATVEASGSATVRASGSATVRAWGSATVEAYDSATVRAWGSATVQAYDSATVRASGSATVEAYDSATVRAWGSATVQATPYVAVHLLSADATVSGGVVIDIAAVDLDDPEIWCAYHGIEVTDGLATVYKAVDDRYFSEHGTRYAPGSTPTAPDWQPTKLCGQGLHFSPTPRQAQAYNHATATVAKYVACGIAVADLIPLGSDKCKAPRVIRACVEVDLDMRPIQAN